MYFQTRNPLLAYFLIIIIMLKASSPNLGNVIYGRLSFKYLYVLLHAFDRTDGHGHSELRKYYTKLTFSIHPPAPCSPPFTAIIIPAVFQPSDMESERKKN